MISVCKLVSTFTITIVSNNACTNCYNNHFDVTVTNTSTTCIFVIRVFLIANDFFWNSVSDWLLLAKMLYSWVCTNRSHGFWHKVLWMLYYAHIDCLWLAVQNSERTGWLTHVLLWCYRCNLVPLLHFGDKLTILVPSLFITNGLGTRLVLKMLDDLHEQALYIVRPTHLL